MIIKKSADVTEEPMPMDGVKASGLRWLVKEEEGARDFFMRLVTMGVGGEIPLHSHPQVHEIYVLSGNGEVTTPEGANPVAPGDFVFIPENEKHGFRNAGQTQFQMICCINKV